MLLARRGLYAILDPEQTLGRDPIAIAEAILSAAPAVLQLRAKSATDRELVRLGRAIRARCTDHGVPFVVNDRADLARLLDADGLHLGQDDLPIDAARRIVGAMPIGRSTHSLEQARAAVREGADLIGFGPVFDTATKVDPDPTVGLVALAEVVREVGIPVVAIGGITVGRIREVFATGVRFAAVIGAIGRDSDPAGATRELVSTLESH